MMLQLVTTDTRSGVRRCASKKSQSGIFAAVAGGGCIHAL